MQSIGVLMVEDSDTDAEIVRSLLDDAGVFAPTRVNSVAEALAWLSQHRADVALLDLGLPDAEGLGSVRAVRDAHPELAVVVLSSEEDPRLALRAVQEGAQDYLPKSNVDAERLARTLRYAVERRRSERLVEDRERFAGTVLDSVPSPVVVIDRRGEVRMVNRAYRRLSAEVGADVRLGRRLSPSSVRPIYGERAPELLDWIHEVSSGITERRSGSLRVRGRPITVNVTPMAGEEGGAVLSHAAPEPESITGNGRDPHTGLPNRSYLLDRLGRVESGGVLRVELHRHAGLVEDLGSAAGDTVAAEAYRRLRETCPADTVVAQLAPGSFAAVVSTGWLVESLAAEAVKALAEPFEVEGLELLLDPRVGAAPVEAAGDPELALRQAGAAMLAARQTPGPSYRIFDDDIDARFRGVGRMESELRQGVRREELVVHYQPEVSITSGRVVGVEALVRWRHPQRGVLAPVEFIPVAEDSGLIIDIGDWVLGSALVETGGWRINGRGRPPGVFVNLSVRELSDPGVVKRVASVLETTGADPNRIGLEITETVLLQDLEAAARVIADLRALGVTVGIDDFGTGYASFGYLRRLPVDFVKVDRSFVERLGSVPGDSAIVRAIVEMATSVGVEVVAEGVETTRQLAELRELGCSVAQGFLFSPPGPADAIRGYLEDVGVA